MHLTESFVTRVSAISGYKRRLAALTSSQNKH